MYDMCYTFRHNTKANLKEAYYGNISRNRAKLKEQEARTGGSASLAGTTQFFRILNMKEGESPTVLFLDGDESHTFFPERTFDDSTVPGVKGDTDSSVQVQVHVCMEMYGDSCEIQMKSVAGLKIPSPEDMGPQILEEKIYILPVCN